MIARGLRFLAGLLLLPVCLALTQTLFDVVRAACPAGGWPSAPGLAFGAGFGLWLLVFFTLPRPVRTYVLAHELTHALWGAAMGARVSKLNVSRQGGSVTLSKTNVWIALAPYFFPLYTALTVLLYGLLSLFMSLERFELLWLGAVGLTWGFHLTFTVTTLLNRQPDIRACGRLFSYALIYALNLLGIVLWVVAVSSVSWRQMGGLLGSNLAAVAAEIARTAAAVWAWWSNK